VYDFSVGVQRELPWNIVIETSYVGNRQQHQPVIFDLNYVQLGTAWQAQYVDPHSAGYNFYGPISASNPGPPLPGSNAMDSVVMRPNRGHAALTFNPNVGVNRYDSWQTSINKRFGQGLTISSSYTLGRLISGTESVGLFQNKWKNYTGYVANTDRRHVATINYTYEFPNLADKLGWNNSFARQLLNSWQIAHMMSFFSGQDYTAGYSVQQANTTTGVDMNRVLLGTGDLAPRLQLAGDPNSGFTMDLAHQFNLSAFSLPGAGTDGTGPRNYVHGRGSFSNDINIAKQFRVHESKVLELRVSLFNAFNQVRRLGINSSIQYKALGKTMADGFKIINTPEANASATTGDALRIYNAYRLGVGHVNITGVEPMRIIEIGMKFRF
jgi:hypothetical protein